MSEIQALPGVAHPERPVPAGGAETAAIKIILEELRRPLPAA